MRKLFGLIIIVTLVYASYAFVYSRDLFNVKSFVENLFGLTQSEEIVDPVDESDVTEQQPEVAAPEGTLILSLAPGTTSTVFAHALDLSETNSRPSVLTSLVNHGQTLHYTAKNNNVSNGGFVLTHRDEPFGDFAEQDVAGIYFVPSIGESFSEELIRIEQPVGKQESNLSWSESADKLVYQIAKVFPRTFEEFRDPANYTVVVYDEDSNTTEFQIEDAFSPNWSPSGNELLYLRSDGMYWYSFELDKEERLIELSDDGEGNRLNTGDSFKVSDDGNYAVWLTPYHNLITVYEIESWNPMQMVELHRIQNDGSEYYWPTFSPDNLQYAVTAYERDAVTAEVTNARVEIRPVTSVVEPSVFDMNNFNPLAVYVDDWLENTTSDLLRESN